MSTASRPELERVTYPDAYGTAEYVQCDDCDREFPVECQDEFVHAPGCPHSDIRGGDRA